MPLGPPPTRRRRAPGPRPARFVLLSLALVASLVAAGILSGDAAGPGAETAAPADAGSVLTPGQVHDPVRAGALYVAHDGSDDADGTRATPLRTIAAALHRITAGGTVAIQGGTWHESLVLEGADAVEIRPWPGETVWLDGAREITSFTHRDGAWAADGYSIDLDRSPTFTRGAPDHTRPGWAFIDPAHPLAADPQQVWVDGHPLRQVASPDELEAETFAVDRDRHRLWLGSDPAGRHVEASDLGRALSIRAAGARVRGIGIRRYAPSLPDFGAVTVEGRNATLDGVTVVASATVGISLQRAGAHLVDVRATGCGLIGIDANHADDAELRRVRADRNNTEHFNHTPNAGGLKITASRRVWITDSVFEGNDGTGLWLDESVENAHLYGVAADDNERHGIHVELSTAVAIVAARPARNRGDGIRIQNSNHVAVVDSTFTDDTRSLQVVQDDRRPTSPGVPGVDPRPGGSTDQTWRVGAIRLVRDRFVAGPRTEGFVAVEDYSQRASGADLGISLADNVYTRSPGSPRWTHLWPDRGKEARTYPGLAEFARATGQDGDGSETTLADTP